MPETRFQFFVLITSAFRTSLPSAVSYGVDRSLRELSLAKILSDCEINNLHSFLKALICYDCCPCSASSACGSAYLPAAFAPAERCSLRIWRFVSNLLY